MKNVAAVIVTYCSGERIAQALPAVLAQVERVYIVDNGSDAATVEAVRRIAADHTESVRALLNATNLGLAAAQNQFIKQALADGFEWILLLDDDSVPADGMVQKMLSAWAGDAQIGILAPRIMEQNTPRAFRCLSPIWRGFGFTRHEVRLDEHWKNVAVVIASGSLIRADVFRKIGLMAEGFFIDYIDYEFCLRARAHGFGILVAGNAALLHRQGNKALHSVGGVGVVAAHYNALRRYYIFRNRLFVLRRFGQQFPFLIPHETLAYAWDIFRIVMFEQEKLVKLRAALRGIKDGLLQPVPEAELCN